MENSLYMFITSHQRIEGALEDEHTYSGVDGPVTGGVSFPCPLAPGTHYVHPLPAPLEREYPSITAFIHWHSVETCPCFRL